MQKTLGLVCNRALQVWSSGVDFSHVTQEMEAAAAAVLELEAAVRMATVVGLQV